MMQLWIVLYAGTLFCCLCSGIIFLTALRTLERRRDNLRALLESNPTLAMTPDAEFAAYRYGLFSTERLSAKGGPISIFGIMADVFVFTAISLIGFYLCALLWLQPEALTALDARSVSPYGRLAFTIVFLLAFSRSFYRMTRQTLQSEYLGSQFLAEAQYLVLVQVFAITLTFVAPLITFLNDRSDTLAIAALSLFVILHGDFRRLFFYSAARLRGGVNKWGTDLVSIIRGLDSEAGERLNGLGISNVHLLAKANPVVLSTSSQYGIYMVCDWIGQAQLASEFGPFRLSAALRLGASSLEDLAKITSRQNEMSVLPTLEERLTADSRNPFLNKSEPEWVSHEAVILALEKPGPLRLRATVEALTNRARVPILPSSSEGAYVDRDLISSAVMEALVAPRLVNYDGWVLAAVANVNSDHRLTVKFMAAKPAFGEPIRLEVTGGIDADTAEFVLETRVGWDQTARKTVTVPVDRNSPPFEFEISGFERTKDAWLQIFQKNRLLASIPLTKRDGLADTASPLA